MSTAQISTLDMNKLNAFIGQFVTDLGAAVHAGMVVIGEKLGLYKALAGSLSIVGQEQAVSRIPENLASCRIDGLQQPGELLIRPFRPVTRRRHLHESTKSPRMKPLKV